MVGELTHREREPSAASERLDQVGGQAQAPGAGIDAPGGGEPAGRLGGRRQPLASEGRVERGAVGGDEVRGHGDPLTDEQVKAVAQGATAPGVVALRPAVGLRSDPRVERHEATRDGCPQRFGLLGVRRGVGSAGHRAGEREPGAGQQWPAQIVAGGHGGAERGVGPGERRPHVVDAAGELVRVDAAHGVRRSGRGEVAGVEVAGIVEQGSEQRGR